MSSLEDTVAMTRIEGADPGSPTTGDGAPAPRPARDDKRTRAKTQRERKRLSKLKRSELLEIILAQSDEIERLRGELQQKDAELESKRIAIAESGSIAEASLKLAHIFTDAQRAADLYVANVKRNKSLDLPDIEKGPDE